MIMNSKIEVENLKCSGCANMIKNELQLMEGVLSVDVDNKTALVDLTYSNPAILDEVKAKLIRIGYPEVNSLHGIKKLTANAKSYVSCAASKVVRRINSQTRSERTQTDCRYSFWRIDQYGLKIPQFSWRALCFKQRQTKYKFEARRS